MRKFMKGCAITALIFILLGLILGVSGSLGNGSTHFSPGEILSAVTLGRISEEKVDDWSDGVTEQIRENMGDVHYDLEDKVDYDSDYEVKSGKIELYVLGDDSQGITDLQVQAGGCVMKIRVSEDNCFRVEADGMRKFQGYVEGGTMEICGTSKATGFGLRRIFSAARSRRSLSSFLLEFPNSTHPSNSAGASAPALFFCCPQLLRPPFIVLQTRKRAEQRSAPT